VNAGTFRLDLFYRIAVVQLALPPLRDRPDDIPMLVEHFLREAGHQGPVEAVIPTSELTALLGHRWPGNVRELRNWVEATLATGEAPQLEAAVSSSRSAPDAQPVERVLALPYKQARESVLKVFEQRYLKHLMAQTSDNVSAASRHAGMDRSYLIKLLQRHGLRSGD
jgi:DNA-binding NtrC family response regulator